MSELIVLEDKDLRDVFCQVDGVKSCIDIIKEKVENELGMIDPSSKKGLEELKKLAYKITRSKTTIDKLGKGLKDELMQSIKPIDVNRRFAKKELEELAVAVRAPYTEWETKERERLNYVNDVKGRLKQIQETYESIGSIEHLEDMIKSLNNFNISEDVFKGETKVVQDYVLMTIERLTIEIDIIKERKAEEEAQQEAERKRQEEILKRQQAEEERLQAERKEIEREKEALRQQQEKMRAEAEAIAEKKRQDEELRIKQEAQENVGKVRDEIDVKIIKALRGIITESGEVVSLFNAIKNNKIPHLKIDYSEI